MDEYLEGKGLTPAEITVFKWQYGYHGDFFMSLFNSIALADDTNIERFVPGFPVEVEGYKKYTQELGWWTNVKNKMEKQD